MVGREAAPELVEGVLHAICFVRLLGLLHPRSEPVLGVEMVRGAMLDSHKTASRE